MQRDYQGGCYILESNLYIKKVFFNFPDDGVDTQSGTKKEDANDKEKKDEEDAAAPAYRAKSILESWVWGRQPGIRS